MYDVLCTILLYKNRNSFPFNSEIKLLSSSSKLKSGASNNTKIWRRACVRTLQPTVYRIPHTFQKSSKCFAVVAAAAALFGVSKEVRPALLYTIYGYLYVIIRIIKTTKITKLARN